MDFESIKWDVETEAETLHESLFGTLNVSSRPLVKECVTEK